MEFRKKQNHACGKVPELGAIFMANRATKKMCFGWKTFGLPFWKADFVRQVKAGMFLFLFEYETRKLYGVYQACCDGDMNISSEAFSSTGNKYPAQVQFRVLWYCKPLSEDEFRPAIKDNYFAPYKFNFGLSKNQVRELLWLFNSRKIRDELMSEQMLPSDPSLIRTTTRSCNIDDDGKEFTFRAQNEYVPEKVNDLQLNKDLENIMPNREVHGRLLIDHDRDIGREAADTALPLSNYRRELSHQDTVPQARNTMDYDYGYNLMNDYELNSGVPYMSCVEKYDPDIPLLADMPATQQLPRYHEGDGRVYADNSVDGRPLIEHDEVQKFTRYFEPIILNSRSPHPVYHDNADGEGPSSYNPSSGTSLQGSGRYPEVHLKSGFFRGLNSSINGEHLKPLSENMLLPSETDDASILRQPVTYSDTSQTVSRPVPSGQLQRSVGIESIGTKQYEDTLLHSSACGRTHETETIVPSFCMKDLSKTVDTNQDSKVCEERQPVSQNKRSVFSRLKPALDADDEPKIKDSQKSIDDMVNGVMETLTGHYCQLLTESRLMKKRVDDVSNKSKKKKHRTWHSQAAKHESVASVEMVSDLPTVNECESESESEIIKEMPLLKFKRRSEVQKTLNAAEAGLGEMSSAFLAEKQSKRRKLVRPSFSEKKLSNDNAVLDEISVNMTLSCQPIQGGSFKTDAPLPCDKEQKPPEAGNLGSGVLAASVDDECRNGLTGSDNLTDGSEQATSNREEDDRAETSTKLGLGGSVNDADFCVDAAVDGQKQKIVSVTEAADNRSNKLAGLDGSQEELPDDLDMSTTHFFQVTNEDKEDPTTGRDEAHVESTSIRSPAGGTSASGQATQVQYFEFFK